jgi:UDP-N-acetyl-D-glucosamine dehydrogenase
MKVSIIGQGYVGLPIALSAAEASHQVVGFDIDVDKISRLRSGLSDSPEVTKEQIIRLQKSAQIKFTSELSDLKDCSIFIIAVPTPLDYKLNPDLTFLKNACELISKIISSKALVINESTSFIGTLRNFIKPTIDQMSSLQDLEYAVAPERIDPGNKNWSVENTPRIIGGLSDSATNRAVNFYSSFCKNVNLVSKPEVAEAAKLFENTFRQVNIALVNEFSKISSHLNFSANEAISAAATKPFGFMPFFPGIGVGGHCIPVDPSYLTYSASQAGISSSLINIANKINLDVAKNIAARIKNALDGDLVNKVIQIAGITYKPNISDLREAPSLVLIQELRNFGAKVLWNDSYIKFHNGEESVPLKTDIDLGLIVTPHDNMNFSIWKDSNIRVFDLSPSQKNYGWSKFL